MRDLIVRALELIGTLFGSKPGRHSAAHLNAPAAPTPAPAEPLPPHVQERNERLDGEEVELIRPYYAAYLRNQEAETLNLRTARKRQRELFWAAMGMDYPGVRLHGAPSA
ncbi:hypothetical protein OG875_13770 [Streptomyces sp. NBC_01498]|uniref:hypothetical protein n=1 Tax=Streptomyces sp. NBC_01498 TaxID=2975870 RepID=UPI002E7C5394|nr:hypothetical protein [Streptomyces sp. NBC_01498]WTL25568.1 hypothetical protein OG875_13770 [Streptomyces sp. NBC_01498]